MQAVDRCLPPSFPKAQTIQEYCQIYGSYTRNLATLHLQLYSGAIDLMNFAGTPPTMTFGGTSFVTTAPAAITALSPIITPGRIVAFAPTQTFFLKQSEQDTLFRGLQEQARD